MLHHEVQHCYLRDLLAVVHDLCGTKYHQNPLDCCWVWLPLETSEKHQLHKNLINVYTDDNMIILNLEIWLILLGTEIRLIRASR